MPSPAGKKKIRVFGSVKTLVEDRSAAYADVSTTGGTDLICGIGVICGQSLPVNPITIVTTDGREVAKPARLLFLRWINAKLTGAHVIEKIPNLRDDVGAYLLPLII